MTGRSSRKKEAAVILNGISLRKKRFYKHYLPALSEIFNVQVSETLSKNDGIALAAKFAEKNVDVILAAGGDGTLNQVINGVLIGRENEPRSPVIGILPLGSANDFARAVGLENSPGRLFRLFRDFVPRKTDVGRMVLRSSEDQRQTITRYFINVADIGMGPEVVRRVLQSDRPFGSAIAYYNSILSVFFSYKPMKVLAESEDWTWEGRLRSLAMANGKYYGHGLCIAPDAMPDDGEFSVFICGNVSVLDFFRHTGTLKSGKKINMKEVLYRSARSIMLTSESRCLMEADGELMGELPASVTILPGKLEMLR